MMGMGETIKLQDCRIVLKMDRALGRNDTFPHYGADS